MFFSNKQEQKSEANEVKIKKLSLEIETLDLETNNLLQHLQVTPEQLTQFIENKENFSSKNWDELQEQKKKLDAKLTLDLESIPNPLKVQKKYVERNVGQHWLYVK